MRRSCRPTAFVFSIAAFLPLSMVAGEKLEIEAAIADAQCPTAHVRIYGTAKAGDVQAFVLPIQFDAERLEVVDFHPSGPWMAARQPDLVEAVGTLANPGQPGLAALVVILDWAGDPTHVIPQRSDGSQELATIVFRVLIPPAAGTKTDISLVDNKVAFGSGPKLVTELIIGGEDYYRGDPSHLIEVKAGSLTAGTLPSCPVENPLFDFLLEGEGRLLADPGAEVEFTIRALIDMEGLGAYKGPTGWSMALRAEDCTFEEFVPGAAIEEATRFRDPADWSVTTEIGDGGSCAVLKVDLGIPLDPGRSPHHVLTMKLKGRVPAGGGCTACRIRFESCGDPPVKNSVTWEGQGVPPGTPGEKCVRLCDGPCEGVDPIAVPADGGETEKTFTLTRCAPSACFRLTSTPRKPLIVTLSDRAGEGSGHENAIFAQCGGEATPAEHDFAADGGGPDQRLVIPSGCGGTTYVQVLARVVPGAGNVLALRAREARAVIGSLSSRQGCPGHAATVSIQGAGFEEGKTVFVLRHTTRDLEITATQPRFVSSRRYDVIFEVPNDLAYVGEYNLDAEYADTPNDPPLHHIESAFEVFGACAGDFVVDLIGKESVRAWRLSSMTVRYENRAKAEIAAPLLLIEGPPGSHLRLSGETGFFRGAVFGSKLQILAVNPEGVAGALAPGAVGEVPIEFIWDPGEEDCTRRCESCPGGFTVRHLAPTGPILCPGGNRPPDETTTQEQWTEICAHLGPTWDAYIEKLVSISTVLGRRGKNPASVGEGFRFAAREALSFPNLALGGRVAGEDGAPLGGLLLFALKDGAVKSCALSSPLGDFTFDRLAAGDYGIEAVGATLTPLPPVTLPISLAGEDLLGIDLQGRPPVGSAHGAGECLPPGEPDLPREPLDLPADLLVFKTSKVIRFTQACDPNEKRGGPTGRGRGRLVDPGQELQYTIHFENLPTATAPAQRVEIIDDLSASGLDPATVCFRDVRFADCLVHLDRPDLLPLEMQLENPTGEYPFTSDCDRLTISTISDGVSDTIEGGASEGASRSMTFKINHVYQEREWPLLLDVSAEVDQANQRIRWVLQTLPPKGGGDLPDEAGFLLPNQTCTRPDGVAVDGRGEGYVSFTVKPKPGLPDGTKMPNRSRVIFDQNPEIQVKEPDGALEICADGLPAKAHSPSPGNGATGINPLTVLKWRSDCRTETYDVVIRRGTDTVTGTVAEAEFRPILDYNTTYAWKVIPKNLDGQTPAETAEEWTFTTALPEPPGVPVNLQLGEGEPAYKKRVTFTWTAAQGATKNWKYAVFLGRREDGDFLEILKTDIGETSYPVERDLFPGEYRWRVVAMDEHYDTPETGTSSDTVSFTVSRPEAPAGLSSFKDCTDGVDLRWNVATGATSYAVKIGPAPHGPIETVLCGPIETTTWNHTVDLPSGRYLWQVYARSEIDAVGTASNLATFTVSRLEPPEDLIPFEGPSNAPVHLRWSPAADATSYKVLAGPAPSGPIDKVLCGPIESTEWSGTVNLAPGDYLWQVVALSDLCAEGKASEPASLRLLELRRFRRGDADGSGKIDLTDPIFTLQFLFLGGTTPACKDAADTDDSGKLDLTDAINCLQYQFLGGPPPPAPGPSTCGPDPTPGDQYVDCEYTKC